MLNLLAVILFFLFPVYAVIFEQILLQVYLWQVKEYRFDRFYSFIRYDRHISVQAQILNLAKIAVLASALFYIISLEPVLLMAVVICFVIYLVQFTYILQNLIGKRLLRPRFKSLRNLLVLSGSFLLVLVPLLILIGYALSFAPLTSEGVLIPVTEPEQLPPLNEILPQIVD